MTNQGDIRLPLAVWLLHDEYDYVDDPNYISVTTLMRPIRHIILPSRIPPENRTHDVEEFIARTLGHAVHDSIEKAWLRGHVRAMKLLGYPDHVIERVRVNPTPEEVRASNDIIPVYLEQRAKREIDGTVIGGKFDLVADGAVEDNKSTSAFAWVNGTRDDEHILQMSLYRWIDAGQPVRKITEDHCHVNYIFTDWSKFQARQNPRYPQRRVESKTLPLLSLSETEKWIRSKLAEIRKYANVPEAHIPNCTDEELWRSAPQYKYFSDPSKTDGRSTRNFDTLSEANRFLAEKGKGIVITKPGEVKRCDYCPAFEACTQKDQYL